MISFSLATVIEIKSSRPGIAEVIVEIDGGNQYKGICYTSLIGLVETGNRVVVNTTAVDLGLGTGGYHFVVWNLDSLENVSGKSLEETDESVNAQRVSILATSKQGPDRGHIMKLRYTPMQLKCLAVEEEDSDFHDVIKDAVSIDGMPVIIGTLHSQLPAVAVTLKEIDPKLRIAYIMTDGAALPLAFSNLAARLKTEGFVDKTITIGHAFGGDFEAINIYSGLVAAKYAAGADIVIVTMGPGIVGTGTKLGYTGIEQGQIINAVNSLGGIAIAIPRISFADKRDRHRGISHHTITALTVASMSKAIVTLPDMDEEKTVYVDDQVKQAKLAEKHDVMTVDAGITLEALKRQGILPTTMGRGIDKEPEFFKAAGAAAIYAKQCIDNNRL